MTRGSLCKVAFVWSDHFEEFDNGRNHPVRQGRFRAVRDYIVSQGFYEHDNVSEMSPEPLPESLLERVHTQEYITRIRRISATGEGDVDIDTPGYRGIYETALWTCGGTISGVKAILRGEIDHFISPTGGFHHAFPDRGGGFCVFNDIAAAVRLLQDRGIKRVAIVDLDVHHGNGTQSYFLESPDVLHISLHEDPEWTYPHSGRVEESGTGKGSGLSVNVPLPMDSGDDVFLYSFREIVPPILDFFRPQFLILVPGFDTHYLDPLAHLVTTTRTTRETTLMLHDQAHKHCDGRLGVVSGGGYDRQALSWGVATVLSVLSGIPYSAPPESPPIQDDSETWELARRTVRAVRARVFSQLGL